MSRTNPQGQTASKSTLLWSIVIGVVVVAGIVAVVATRSGNDGDTSTTASGTASGSGVDDDNSDDADDSGEAFPDPRELRPVVVDGAPLTPFEDPTADDSVGEAAPVLEGVDISDEAMKIGGGGKPTVITFLAHWCPHCQAEVPVLVEWMDENGLPEDVDLVGLTTAFDETRGNWPPGEWLAEEGWTLPTMVDPDGAAAEAYGLTSFPYFVALDADGNVAARASGELSTAEFEALIDAARGASA